MTTETRERAVMRGWCLKKPDGSLQVPWVMGARERIQKSIDTAVDRKRWTAVEVEIRELEPEKDND